VALSLLGGTILQLDGAVVETPDWRRGRVRALLTFLVLNPDTTREATIAALWPDADNSSGRRNLRSTLNVLNAVLEPARHGGDAPFFVRSVGQILRLHRDGNLDVDVDRFERYLEEATAHEEAGAPSLSIDPYRQATSQYRGDLLPDAYDDWVLFARDRLRSRYVAAAVRCGELLVATGRAGEAIDVIAPVLAVEPWSEPAHRTLIAAHLETGDTAAARRALTTCHEALEDIGGLSEEATLALERRLSRR
jgi:DNA-binding SARP family transcriptional activator